MRIRHALGVVGAMMCLAVAPTFVQAVPPTIDDVSPSPGEWLINGDALDSVTLTFSQGVSGLDGAVTAWVMSTPAPGAPATCGVSVEPVAVTVVHTNGDATATLMFDPPINPFDDPTGTPRLSPKRLTVVVGDTVVNGAGEALNGEVATPLDPVLPTGNSRSDGTPLPGGEAVFRFTVIQGDVNQDGQTGFSDTLLLNAAIAACGDCDVAGCSGTIDERLDFNGDGCIDVADVGILQAGFGGAVPSAGGQSPSVANAAPICFDPSAGDSVDSLVVTFSTAMNSATIGTNSLIVVDSNGQLVRPSGVVDVLGGETVVFEFTPGLSVLESYRVTLSNALTDACHRPLPLTVFDRVSIDSDSDCDGVPSNAMFDQCLTGQVLDCDDNCPDDVNPDQTNTDGLQDGGDACDDDLDDDGVLNDLDNCPTVPNGAAEDDQADVDEDGFGDACDDCPMVFNEIQGVDSDGDGVSDACDNCPDVFNPTQANADGADDGGDACDADNDDDGLDDADDNCLNVPNGLQEAGFPGVGNQTDTDFDGFGDACDSDDDNDSILDVDDNCPFVANEDQLNTDGAEDGGNACDDDDDNDTILDVNDNCPLVANTDQINTDGAEDGGDACDDDDDNDTILDVNDNCPLLASLDQTNTDGDAEGDICDNDDDNDGVLDTTDNCPLVSNVNQLNTDGAADGGDACDTDDDNDTILDVNDNCPTVSNVDQEDTDGNNIGNACDQGGQGGGGGGGGGGAGDTGGDDGDEESGTTGTVDENGGLVVSISGGIDSARGIVEIIDGDVDATVTLALFNNEADPGLPGQQTGAGFADALAVGWTLDVANTLSGDFIVIVQLIVPASTLTNLELDPADADLHVLDEQASPQQWVRAGTTFLGESDPTETVGDYGYLVDGNFVNYWAVRDVLSTFAIGQNVDGPSTLAPAELPTEDVIDDVEPPADDVLPTPDDGTTPVDDTLVDVVEQPADQPVPPPGCAPCGILGMGTLPMIMAGMVSMRRRRRLL
jgi:Thrombospondin type 3 repeat/Bacterial Ig-like domain